MLVAAFGPAYESYRHDVSAVVPFLGGTGGQV
jgi:protein-S-isoprenylcysteine O-methyltransferase Ste14